MKNEFILEEIECFVRIVLRFGIRKVKFMGGELIVREDIFEIVKRIKFYVIDFSMIINGSRLKELVKLLVKVGFDRVNVLFYSLKLEVYKRIIGVDGFEVVFEGIEEVVKYFLLVKFNMIVMKGLNDGEIWDMVEFVVKIGIIF